MRTKYISPLHIEQMVINMSLNARGKVVVVTCMHTANRVSSGAVQDIVVIKSFWRAMLNLQDRWYV